MVGERRAVTYDGVEYAPGKQFRVIKEGAQLLGWRPSGPSAFSGWRQPLAVGDVITCTGYGPGWGSDPGYGVEFTSDASKKAGAVSCDFAPATGGVFAYHPAPGYLEEM